MTWLGAHFGRRPRQKRVVPRCICACAHVFDTCGASADAKEARALCVAHCCLVLATRTLWTQQARCSDGYER